MTVRLRFAPSPTGYLHIGGIWTALFGWMYVQRHNGQFILRIEDTDTNRFVSGAMENLMASMRWFGIEWDEGPDVGGPYGPYIQTERTELYKEWAHWLVDHGHAYKCFATQEELAEMRRELEAKGDFSGYDRRYRDISPEEVARLEVEGHDYVIRFKMPLEGSTTVHDLLRGDIVTENKQLSDLVLLKSNGIPTYHLAVVVDDHFMKITHVTRGIEWLSTAPLHIRLYEAFGWEAPVLVHFPVILNPNGKGKLSKRKDVFLESGEKVLVRASEFMEAGFLKEALVNFLTNVGWSFGNDQEKYTLEEAIARFDLADLSPVSVRLPYDKLPWLNGQYIQAMEPRALAEAVKPYLEKEGFAVDVDQILPAMTAMSVRMRRFQDAIPFLRFLFEETPLPETAVSLTHKKLTLENAQSAIQQTRDFLASVEPFELDTISAKLMEIGEAHTDNGRAGPFLGKMRMAVTGQKVSPPLFESIMALGRERTVARLDQVLALFGE
ncbi:MAG: glutamate--tRNA ligase [Chloroflexota bacterium]